MTSHTPCFIAVLADILLHVCTAHLHELTVPVLVNLCLGNKAAARLLHERRRRRRRKEGVVDLEHSALTGDEDAPYCNPLPC